MIIKGIFLLTLLGLFNIMAILNFNDILLYYKYSVKYIFTVKNLTVTFSQTTEIGSPETKLTHCICLNGVLHHFQQFYSYTQYLVFLNQNRIFPFLQKL